jgi:anti-sigma factor RsiW
VIQNQAGEGIDVQIDPAQFARLMRDVRGFDAELAKAIRRRLRDAADPAVKDVKRRLLSAPSHQRTHSLRKALAAGTKLSIRTGAGTAGVSIRTTGAKLPADKQAMVRAFDKRSFRHRVFGRDVWKVQPGRPYFGAVLDERKQPMQAAMEHALDDAAATIHAGEVNT